jgi:NAD(P)-dependent dehydrogenase (short-subunit alcohol dehydrogenase family)
MTSCTKCGRSASSAFFAARRACANSGGRGQSYSKGASGVGIARGSRQLRSNGIAKAYRLFLRWGELAELSLCRVVTDKQILITGATNGIGLAAAEALVSLGTNLAIVGRSKSRTRLAAARIRAAARRGATVATFVSDLSSQASVRRLAAEVLARYPRLDVLVNNAGAVYGERQLTTDGIELTWAVNHLASFLLTTLLLDRLKDSAPARIITTASEAHQGAHIPFSDLNAERSYRSFGRYSETKLANILFTSELARRLEGTGVTANCFHPGLVATGFNRNNGWLMDLGMTILEPVSRTRGQHRD